MTQPADAIDAEAVEDGQYVDPDETPRPPSDAELDFLNLADAEAEDGAGDGE